MTNRNKLFNRERKIVSKYLRMPVIIMAVIVLVGCKKNENVPPETATTTETLTTAAETIAKVTTIKEYVESLVEEGNLKESLVVLVWNETTGTPIANGMWKWSEEEQQFELTDGVSKFQLQEGECVILVKEEAISEIVHNEAYEEVVEKNNSYGQYVVLRFKDFFGEKLLELRVDEFRISLTLEGKSGESISIAEESTSIAKESESSFAGEIPKGVSFEDFCDSDYVKSTIPKKSTVIIIWYPSLGTGKVLVGGENVHIKELEGDARLVFYSNYGQYYCTGVSNEDIISQSISLGLSVMDTEYVLNNSKIIEETNLIFEYKTVTGDSSIEITLVP